jgi:hypothetical protein
MVVLIISSLASSKTCGGEAVRAVIVTSPSSPFNIDEEESFGRDDQAPSFAVSRAISGESSQAWMRLFRLSISVLPEVASPAEKVKC